MSSAKPCHKAKGQGRSPHLNFVHSFVETCSSPVKNCVLHGGISKLFSIINHLKKTISLA